MLFCSFVISHAIIAVPAMFLCNARVLHICVYMHNENHAASHTDGLVAVSPGKVFRPNTRIESQHRGDNRSEKPECYHSVRTIKKKPRLSGEGAGCTACLFPT